MPRFWQVSSPYATPFAPVIPTFLSEDIMPWASSRLIDLGQLSPAFTGDEAIVAQPSGPVWRGNEPSGMTQISDRPFNSKTEDANWEVSNAANIQIVTDVTAPQSPSNVMRETYPFGFAGGSAHGSTALTWTPHQRVLYVTWWFKYSSNWEGHLTSVNKQFYAWAGGAPIIYMEAYGAGTSGSLRPRIVQQGTPTDNVWLPNLVPSADCTRGVWHMFELILTGNSAGNADGALDFYLDGVHVGNNPTSTQFTTGACVWEEFHWDPVWGGVTGTVSDPAGQTLDCDHCYVSRKA